MQALSQNSIRTFIDDLAKHHKQQGFLILLGGLVIFLLISRFLNFDNEQQFIADNGLEFAILAKMKDQLCVPNLGPLLSVENIFIPPTYFYYIYYTGGFTLDPSLTGHISNISELFTVAFLAGSIWLVTNQNKRLFLVGFLVVSCSTFLYNSSRLVWHPNPVNLWLSLSLFLLILGKKTQRLDAYLGSLATFWFATSIYPSPILLIGWYFLEVVLLLRRFFHNWLGSVALASLIMIATGLPFYIMQLVFEAQHQWPTITTISVAANQIFSNSTSVHFSFHGLMTFVNTWLNEFLYSVLYVDSLGVAGGWEKIFFVGGMCYLLIIAIQHRGHLWLTRFPYLLISAVISHMLFFQYFLPGRQYPAHWFGSILIIFIISIFEAAAKLKSTFLTRTIFGILLVITLTSNISLLWANLNSTREENQSSLEQKEMRMQKLNEFFVDRQLSLEKTLIINQDVYDSNYEDSFMLQYNAMDNWTLTGYQTLLPPLNKKCNSYHLFSTEEIQHKATNLLLLDTAAHQSKIPAVLFQTFQQKLSFKLDENNVAVWYVNTEASE